MARKHRQPRGMALVIVLTAVGLAAALGFVMLSTATLQNRAAGNQARLATADYLAESGLNLAMYYLQYPDRAPGYPTPVVDGWYWSGTGSDVAIAGSIDGTVNVTVTRDASDPWSYEVACVAKAGTNSETKVTRTTGARVYVRNEFVIKHSAAFNNSVTVGANWTMQGDVWTAKKLSIAALAPFPSITGVGYCQTRQTGVGWLTPAGGFKAVPNAGWPGPSGTNDLNLYKTYNVNDSPYVCEYVTSLALASVAKNPTASNPGGILFKDATSGGAFALNGDVTINGTLVVQGDLQIKGANIIINAQPGFPALIVTGTLEIFQKLSSLTVNGICFVGTTIKSNGAKPIPSTDSSTFNVNGALLIGTPGGTPITSPFTVTTVVKYDATKAKAPELTPVQHVAKGVSIVRWGLP